MIRLIAILLLFTACARPVEYVPVYQAPDCYIAPRPAYPMLNTGEHVASPANMRTLMLIISEQSAYTEGLEASIKCFLSTDAPKSEGGL